MRIVDEAETLAWFSSRGLVGLDGLRSGANRALWSAFPRKAPYYITGLRARRKTAIARVLASRFSESGGGMLWIDEWGIWPSCEHMNLFEGYRKSLGETRLLIDSPGHIFTAGDKEIIFSLLSMALYFIWGAILSDASGDEVVRISHDDWIDVFARGPAEPDSELFSVLACLTGGQHE